MEAQIRTEWVLQTDVHSLEFTLSRKCFLEYSRNGICTLGNFCLKKQVMIGTLETCVATANSHTRPISWVVLVWLLNQRYLTGGP